MPKKFLKKPQVVHPQAETRSTSTRPEGTVLVPPSEDVLVMPLVASIPIVPCASANHSLAESIPIVPCASANHSLAASIPIVPCASADHYALEFNSVGTAEERKQDILWIVLRIFHEASRLPGEDRSIPEYSHIIRKHLENLQQVRVDVILEIGDKDVVNGLPNHAGNIAYREIIREWIERYKSTETKSLKRKVVEELMLSLREDGFRFLEKIDSSGKIDGWQVMDFVSTRNKVVKSLSTCKTTRKGDAPDDTTGAPLGVDTVLYSDKDILFGKVSNYKRKHPGNIVYRDKVMSVLEEFWLQTSAEEKLKISRSVVDDLRKQDYCFVLEAEEGVFNQIELSSVVQKVYKCLKDKLKRTNPCKPKIHGEKDILCGQSKGAHNHPGNIAYHNKLMSVLPLYQRTATPVEKHNIAIKVVDNLKKEDYRFVVESDEGVWNETKSEFTIRKVKLWLNDHSARAAKAENTQTTEEKEERSNEQTEESKE